MSRYWTSTLHSYIRIKKRWQDFLLRQLLEQFKHFKEQFVNLYNKWQYTCHIASNTIDLQFSNFDTPRVFFTQFPCLKSAQMWLPVDVIVKYVTMCHTESVPLAMVILFSSLNQIHVYAQHESFCTSRWKQPCTTRSIYVILILTVNSSNTSMVLSPLKKDKQYGSCVMHNMYACIQTELDTTELCS